MYKRIKILGVSFAIILGLLVLRLAYIQIPGHEELSAVAIAQQNITLDGADTRGVIYDRNGTPIVGGHEEYIYIIKSDNFDGETQAVLNEVYAEEISNEEDTYRVFASNIYSKNAGERLIRNSGAYILETARRYRDNQPAVHIIGYVNQKDYSGASGLELMYNDQLGLLQKNVSATADVNGTLLRGYGLTVKSAADEDIYVTDGIVTTLESGLQQEVERILAGCSNDGAIVVMTADTGEIVASASTPVFDPERIDEYMESDNGELINKVTQGTYPPGSVFKIIVAAAALEAGVSPDKLLTCTGSETVNGHNVKCETGGENGHGKISFERAFADSCNSAFIKLGKIVGAEAIIDMAERFGLGNNVLDGFPEEQAGNLMSLENTGGAAIANLSIGQGETLVTPLQVAAMTTIVANYGVSPGVKIITTDEKTESECIAYEIASNLQKMMEATMMNGTGSSLELPVSSAAKTGSAESVQQGKEVIHGWMTGYVPAEDPKYIITAFVEDGKSGRGSAGPLFCKVAEYLYDNDMFIYETDF